MKFCDKPRCFRPLLIIIILVSVFSVFYFFESIENKKVANIQAEYLNLFGVNFPTNEAEVFAVRPIVEGKIRNTYNNFKIRESEAAAFFERISGLPTDGEPQLKARVSAFREYEKLSTEVKNIRSTLERLMFLGHQFHKDFVHWLLREYEELNSSRSKHQCCFCSDWF